MNSSIKILKALIPYSKDNLALSFKPNVFFNELEKQESMSQSASRNAYSRAIEGGLIEIDDSGVPRLTKKGRRKLAPFTAQKLKRGKLMIIFDIPESLRPKRDILRASLREFGFRQVQRSVWITDVDCKYYIDEEIKLYSLHNFVKTYEVIEI